MGKRKNRFTRGRAVVATAAGEKVLSDLGAVVHLSFRDRPSNRLQAIPLVTSGAAKKYGFSDAEIALACGSHGGSPLHVATAKSILKKNWFISKCT